MAAASVPPTPSSGSWDFTCNLEVDYGSEENASIVYRTLAVDKELQPDKVKREMTLIRQQAGRPLCSRGGPVPASIVQRICGSYGTRDKARRRIWSGHGRAFLNLDEQSHTQ